MSQSGNKGLFIALAAAGLVGALSLVGTALYQMYEESHKTPKPRKKSHKKRGYISKKLKDDPSLGVLFHSMKMCGQIEQLAGEMGYKATQYKQSASEGNFSGKLSNKLIYKCFSFCEIHELIKLKRVCSSWNNFITTMLSDRKYLQNCALRGFNAQFRGQCWLFLSQTSSSSPKNDEKLRLSPSEEKSAVYHKDSSILRDLPRTFPHHELFQDDKEGQDKLFKILRDYAIKDAQVGYVQGMNFLVAIMMTQLQEKDVYLLLDRIMFEYDVRTTFVRALPRLKLNLYQFEKMMDLYLNPLSVHLKSIGIYPIMYASEWFMTLFAYSLPEDFVERIWDLFFINGWPVLHCVGLAIMQKAQYKLIDSSFDKALRELKSLTEHIDSIDDLLHFASFFEITPAMLDEQHRHFIDQKIYLKM